ncbi:SWIM zinc finger family protein [Streptomyces lanatus]
MAARRGGGVGEESDGSSSSVAVPERRPDAPEQADEADSEPVADAQEPVGPGIPSASRTSSDLDPSGRARRAADGAREALRAAREERERTRSDEAARGASGTRRPHRPASTGSGSRRDPGSDSLRSRDVRGLLAGAFRMPADDSPQGEDTSMPGTAAQQEHEPTNSGSPSPSQPAEQPSEASAAPPATPQLPLTMAAPTRDGDLRRTFPAFPPRPADGDRFAESWWGDAWVRALEEGALDRARLGRGRGYAREGHVDAITVTPGLVLAYVRGSRPRPYRVQVRLRTLDDADWARFLDAVASRPGHIAALLDKEMPQSLAECGVPLLPGPGDLDPRCSCPDRGHPCKHAAALCYQTARLLDADPFVLLLLRGRGERQLLDALSRLSAARAARAAQEKEPAPLAGVRATEALDPQRRLPPLPAPLPPPPHPEQPPAYPAAPGGPDPFALDQLATDAAARAHALLTSGRDPVGELTLWQDAVRLAVAAARPGSGLTAATRALYASLASAADRTTSDLARAVAAWRQGGLEGLAALEEPWDPPAGRFDRARPLLLAADLPAFRPWRNRLTHPRGHLQLRLGHDGLWYPYESEPGHDDWWPRGTPDLDPVGALTGLDSAGAVPEA